MHWTISVRVPVGTSVDIMGFAEAVDVLRCLQAIMKKRQGLLDVDVICLMCGWRRWFGSIWNSLQAGTFDSPPSRVFKEVRAY